MDAKLYRGSELYKLWDLFMQQSNNTIFISDTNKVIDS